MLEVEVFGAQLAPEAPAFETVLNLCVMAAASAGVEDGHLAIEYVDRERIAALNAEHRGQAGPTDVLSFPIDGAVPFEDAASPQAATSTDEISHPPVAHFGDLADARSVERELGDVVICPEHTADLREAIVHGVLHLVGLDHEADNGEMLALQAQLLAWERG